MPPVINSKVTIPEKFDPDRHCGGTARSTQTACLLPAGAKTDHPGVGRCWLHGGATPIKHGRYSDVARDTIFQRIEQAQNDPKLLSLDRQLAALHILFEMQLKRFAAQVDSYEDIIEAIEHAAANGLAVPEFPPDIMPQLDLPTLDMMNKLAKTIFEMRFHKRFSMPISQVGQILLGLIDEFERIAKKYRIPDAARVEFAHSIRGMRSLNAPQEDPQLDYAGGVRMIEAGAP